MLRHHFLAFFSSISIQNLYFSPFWDQYLQIKLQNSHRRDRYNFDFASYSVSIDPNNQATANHSLKSHRQDHGKSETACGTHFHSMNWHSNLKQSCFWKRLRCCLSRCLRSQMHPSRGRTPWTPPAPPQTPSHPSTYCRCRANFDGRINCRIRWSVAGRISAVGRTGRTGRVGRTARDSIICFVFVPYFFRSSFYSKMTLFIVLESKKCF